MSLRALPTPVTQALVLPHPPVSFRTGRVRLHEAKPWGEEMRGDREAGSTGLLAWGCWSPDQATSLEPGSSVWATTRFLRESSLPTGSQTHAINLAAAWHWLD